MSNEARDDETARDSVVTMTMSQIRNASSHKCLPVPDDDNEDDKNKEVSKKKPRYSVRFHRESITLINEKDAMEYDLAHDFQEHSYGYPTDCDICNGLLVGLWSQGLQCKACGLNVHRGGGVGDHDDCRAEAMFTPCMGFHHPMSSSDKNLGQALAELRHIADEKPNFFGALYAQMERDTMTHVANAVVAAGVDGEKDKKFRRFKEKFIPLLEWVDAMEARGKLYCILLLLRFHILAEVVIGILGYILFLTAVMMRHGDQFQKRTFHLALIHDTTSVATVMILGLMTCIVQRLLAKYLRRKAILIDRFLKEKLTIDAKEDLGVSVVGAARRAVFWSEQAIVSSAIGTYISLTFWWISQPFYSTLEAIDHHATCKAAAM